MTRVQDPDQAFCRRRSTSTQNLLTGNPIWLSRTQGRRLSLGRGRNRAGRHRTAAARLGVDWDLRRDMPYSSYEKFQFKVPISNGLRRLGALRCSHGGDARVGKDLPAGARRHARGPIKADAPKVVLPDREKMKTQMEVAHLSLQDCDRRLRGSGRRGLPGDRIAARRDGLLRGVATARQSPIACTCAIPLSQRCRRCRRCARDGCWPTWLQ